MSGGLTYREMTEADAGRVCTLIGQAFGMPGESCDRWVRFAGLDRFRVVHRVGEEPSGCLLIADIGQHFGGRAVSMEGVAGVAVAPEARGKGIGAHMMRAMLLDMHRRGVALSTLYPATQVLYRRVGYEQAGFANVMRLNASTIGATREDRSAEIRPVREEDWPRIVSAYREAYAEMNGTLERRTYIWDRVRNWRGEKTDCFVIDDGGRIEGFVAVLMRADAADPSGRKEVFCTAVHGFTARGARRVLAFLNDYSSMGTDVVFYCGPANPLLLLLPEQRWHRQAFGEVWMTRIVDVEKALVQRGYPAGLSGTVAFDVADDLIEENNGVFTLEVSGGVGRVKRGAAGATRAIGVHVRDLVPMYSGLHSPTIMARLGRATGPASALALAGAMFAAGTPAMEEHF
ncbi:MAG: GNAT family N-acetyltransferase [Phycisphaerae bacterium]|nr:GNAT family N-acetyltransferase [Phycisphaerae bacterium]